MLNLFHFCKNQRHFIKDGRLFLVKAKFHLPNPLPKEIPRIELTNESTKLNNSAHQKLPTANPLTISAASITIKALITNKNKPKVRMVIGMVKNIKIGLIVMFNKAKSAAISIPVIRSSTTIPGSKYAVKMITKPATTSCKRIERICLDLIFILKEVNIITSNSTKNMPSC